MNDWTIISYPSPRDNLLLSLTESRSRYMLPFGGRFRVIDFTIRNAFASNSRSTIIYNNVEDDLEKYVNAYGEEGYSPIRIVNREFSDLHFFRDLIVEAGAAYYIIYNGDYPSIIDFSDIVKKFQAKKGDSLLYRMVINDKPSMAYKLLVTGRKALLKTITRLMKDKRPSANIFETIINAMINAGIRKTTFHAHYWPITNVPDYYALSRKVIWDRELFNLIYGDNKIRNQIMTDRYAHVGEHGRIVNSFISDYCTINGKVENSIIYPGVEIGRDSVVRDSIILPFVKIGNGSRIMKAVIDESTDAGPEIGTVNIGNSCRIGSEGENLKNNDFPRALYGSITMIGKNNKIPDEARIGGACYVASGVGEKYFTQKKFLYDGLSAVTDAR